MVSLDVSGGGTCVSLTPFHIGEAGSDGGQTNNNNNNNNNTTEMPPEVSRFRGSNFPSGKDRQFFKLTERIRAKVPRPGSGPTAQSGPNPPFSVHHPGHPSSPTTTNNNFRSPFHPAGPVPYPYVERRGVWTVFEIRVWLTVPSNPEYCAFCP